MTSSKYLVSIIMFGEKDSINKVIDILNKNLRIEFSSTLIKLIMNRDNTNNIEFLTKNRCREYNGVFKGSVMIETTINTSKPNKIAEKIVNDEIIINNYLSRLNRYRINLYIAVKALSFTKNDFKQVDNTLISSIKV